MVKSIISVVFSEIKFLILSLIFSGKFKYKGIQRFSPNTEISIGKNAKISFGKKVRAHSGCKIRARENAIIEIGNDVAFNYNCILTSHELISIGDGAEIGPGVLFYDHDHDIHGHSIKEGLYRTSPIKIGKNVWIGANAIILRGVEIGDNSIIGAGTIVRKGSYPSDSIITNNNSIVVRSVNAAKTDNYKNN